MPLSKSCFGGLFLINDNDSQHKFLPKYGKEEILKLYIKHGYILYSNDITIFK